MSAVDALAIVASVVFLVRLLPQPVRLARRGVAVGVSALAALNAVISALAWMAYGLQADLPVVWGVSVLALGPSVWQAWLLRRDLDRRDLLGATLFVGALLAAAALDLLGVALGGTVLVTTGPQVARAVRSDDLAGLAPATWWVAIVDAATWGAYGWAIGDAALVGYFVVLLGSAVTVLWRIGATARAADGSMAGTGMDLA